MAFLSIGVTKNPACAGSLSLTRETVTGKRQTVEPKGSCVVVITVVLLLFPVPKAQGSTYLGQSSYVCTTQEEDYHVLADGVNSLERR